MLRNSETSKVIQITLAKSLLNEFKKEHFFVALYRQHYFFLFYNDFSKLLIITKDSLIDS